MTATVSVASGQLDVSFSGMDRVWEMKSRLSVPLAEVQKVEVMKPTEVGQGRFSKISGEGMGPAHSAGYFSGDDGTEVWSVHGEQEVLVVTIHNGKYSRLVLGVAEPQAAAAQLQRELQV